MATILAGCRGTDSSRTVGDGGTSPGPLPAIWRLRVGDIVRIRLSGTVALQKTTPYGPNDESFDFEGMAALRVLSIEPGNVCFCEVSIPVIRRFERGSRAKFDSDHEEPWRQPLLTGFLSIEGGLRISIDDRLYPGAVIEFAHALELALPAVESLSGSNGPRRIDPANGLALEWKLDSAPSGMGVVAEHFCNPADLPFPGPVRLDWNEIREALASRDLEVQRPWREWMRRRSRFDRVLSPRVVASKGRYTFASPGGVPEAGERVLLIHWTSNGDFVSRTRHDLQIEVTSAPAK